MSQYRCAACGSPNVQRVDRNDGFSYKKALVGTAVFGTIGAVAGINGKQSSQYVCPDCGQTRPLPMDNIKKDLIDTVMIAPDRLAPKLYPDLYAEYAYLRKERESNISDAIASTYETTIEFNDPSVHSEQEVRTAIINFQKFMSYLLYERLGDRIKRGAYDELGHLNWDVPIIIEGMEAVGVIRQSLLSYPQFKDADIQFDATGKYIHKLHPKCVCFYAVLIDMLLIYGDMKKEEAIALAQRDKMYHAVMAFLLKEEIAKGSPVAMSEDSLQTQKDLAWASAFNQKKRLGLNADMLIDLDRNNQYSFPLRIINESLYVKNRVSNEIMLAQAMPDMIGAIRQQENRISSLQNEINRLHQSGLSYEEEQYQQKIESFRRNQTSYRTEITGLKKKIFGGKKAKQKIAALEKRIIELEQQIYEQQALMAQAQEKRMAYIQNAVKDVEGQIATVQNELNDLLKQKEEYIQQIPQWICIAGPDMEK